MHRDIVDQIHSSLETDFVMTTSLEGNIKFWKKNYIGIEFVKQLKAHQGKISGISVSKSGLYLATCSYKDESLKIFDISNFLIFFFTGVQLITFFVAGIQLNKFFGFPNVWLISTQNIK